MGLGWHAFGQGQFNGGENGLLIVLEHQGEDIDHLAVTAGLAQHMILQLSEGRRQFEEGSAIPKRPRLALDDCQIVPPIVNRPGRQMVAALDHTSMFAQDVTLCRHGQSTTGGIIWR